MGAFSGAANSRPGVDDSTLEYNGNQLRVKAGGIGSSQMTAGTIKSQFSSMGPTGNFTSLTHYLKPGGSVATDPTLGQWVATFAGTCKNLRARLTSGASTTISVTAQKNATPQSLTVTSGAAVTDTEYTDTSNSFTFAAGDVITFAAARASGSNGVSVTSASAEVDPS